MSLLPQTRFVSPEKVGACVRCGHFPDFNDPSLTSCDDPLDCDCGSCEWADAVAAQRNHEWWGMVHESLLCDGRSVDTAEVMNESGHLVILTEEAD